MVNLHEMEQHIWLVSLSTMLSLLSRLLTIPLGPIVHINVLGQPLIILNTHKAAADLLERRAAIYSDRLPTAVADMMTGGHLFGLAGSTDV